MLQLRQLHSVLAGLLREPPQASEIQDQVYNALTDLGLSKDQFLVTLFSDVLKGEVGPLPSMARLTTDFAAFKDATEVISFIKDDTVASFWLGIGRYAFRHALVGDRFVLH